MFEIICGAPLILKASKVLDDDACLALRTLAGRSIAQSSEVGAKRRAPLLAAPASAPEQAVLDGLGSVISSVLGQPLLQPWVTHATTPENGVGPRSASLGLHVDTMHSPRRYATVLVYLSSIELGGGTVFPLAQVHAKMPWLQIASERAVEAARSLLRHDIQHTSEVCRTFERNDAIAIAADMLESRCADLWSGLTTQPSNGDALLFFTRDGDGCIDPRSWHCGLAVLAETKWTLQNFIEVPDDVLPDQEAAYINDRRNMVLQCACK